MNLIHRSYLEIGSEVHIDMFDDRIEIYSPGVMYDGAKMQDRNLMQVPSRWKNSIIADIFNRLKYMDRRGSGCKKIIGVTGYNHNILKVRNWNLIQIMIRFTCAEEPEQ